MQSKTNTKTMTKRATCECGHARADHLRGVGCCVAYAEPDAAGDDLCDCGVFRGAGDIHEDGGLSFGFATADGRASAMFRTTPDAEAPLRQMVFAASERTRELFAAALTGHVDTLEPLREPAVPISTADVELDLVLSYIAKVSEEAPASVAVQWRKCLAGLSKVLRLKMHRGRGAGSPT